MDKETLSNYGWIVICVLVMAVMIALSTPFGQFISDAVWNTAQGLFDVNDKALNAVGINTTENATQTGKIIRLDNVSATPHNPTIVLSGGSITDFSDVSVTRTGKNLFDTSKLAVDEYTTNLRILDANSNTIQFTKNNNASTGRSCVGYEMYLPAGTYYLTAIASASDGGVAASWVVTETDSKETQIAQGTLNEGATNNMFTITKSGIYKIKICAKYAAAKGTTYTVSNIQLEYGQVSAFEPYTSQTVKANADGTVSGISSISPSMTIFTDKDATISCEYLSSEVTNTPPVVTPEVPETTAAISKTVATVNAGDVISLESNAIKKNKTLTFNANITSLGSIELRHGENVYGASKIVIDSTTIKCYNYTSSSTLTSTLEHGLTISGDASIVATVGKDSKLSITVTSNGKTFTKGGINWMGTNGKIELKSNNTTMKNLTLSWDCLDYSDEIWFFGDSYFSYSEARWPYYLAPNYDNFLLSGYPGAGSSAMYSDFQTALTHGTPKIAVWCLGMNDQDSNTAINSSWKTNVEKFIATCEAKGIIPILATVPNVPERVNYYKNEYVRNSGYRYIDFASAVGANEIGSGWYDGMLGSDGVHPTAAGAQALANQILIDLPELKQ